MSRAKSSAFLMPKNKTHSRACTKGCVFVWAEKKAKPSLFGERCDEREPEALRIPGWRPASVGDVFFEVIR